MTICFDFIGSGIGKCGALVASPINDLPEGPVKLLLHLVQNAFWVFILGECLPEMIREGQDCYTQCWPYG